MLAQRLRHPGLCDDPTAVATSCPPLRQITLPVWPAASISRLAKWRPCWRPRFPNRHLIFATLGLCDFVQTCFILSLGGAECNQIALWMMQRWGLAGAALYKLGLVALIIGIVEWTAFRDLAAARRLANYTLILGTIPAFVGLMLLVIHFGLHLI